MNADGFLRIISGSTGPVQTITLRRPTPSSSPSSINVTCRAAIVTGISRSATDVIGDIQQTFDTVMITKREIDAASWPAPPRHGDQVVYSDGRVAVQQGRAQTVQMDSDVVFVLRCLGGG